MEEGKRGKKKMKVGEREEGNVGDRQELEETKSANFWIYSATQTVWTEEL